MALSRSQRPSTTPNRYSDYIMSGTKARSPGQSGNMAAFKHGTSMTKDRNIGSDREKIKELELELRVRDKKISELMKQIRILEGIKPCSVSLERTIVGTKFEIGPTTAAAAAAATGGVATAETGEMSQGGIDSDDKTDDKTLNL